MSDFGKNGPRITRPQHRIPSPVSNVSKGLIAEIMLEDYSSRTSLQYCLGASRAMVRYSIKLPIGRFFSVTTYLLVGLSFVLIGKGVIALQEAAIIGISPLPISFEVDWIGLKSTWQSLFGQFTVVVLFAVFTIHSRFFWRYMNFTSFKGFYHFFSE